MSRPSETASLPLGHRWAPSIDEVRQGGIDRRLSRAASPHLHPPRRVHPPRRTARSHEETCLPRVSHWAKGARCWASKLVRLCRLAASSTLSVCRAAPGPQRSKDGAGVPRRRSHLGELTLLACLGDSTNVRWHDAATPARRKRPNCCKLWL